MIIENDKEITHYHVADNSDAFRTWLSTKGIEYIPLGHLTAIPLKGNDIFAIGFEFGIYSYLNNPKYKHETI